MIKNYTSNQDPELSVARIEEMLIELGASHISKEYSGDKEIIGISFMIKNPVAAGRLGIRVPANIDKVLAVLDRHSAPRGRLDARQKDQRTKRLNAQARRTAWKLVHDWVEIQLALITMEQCDAARFPQFDPTVAFGPAELMEVFLPYLWNGRGSYYEGLKENKFLGITDQTKPAEASSDEAH